MSFTTAVLTVGGWPRQVCVGAWSCGRRIIVRTLMYGIGFGVVWVLVIIFQSFVFGYSAAPSEQANAVVQSVCWLVCQGAAPKPL